MTELMNMDLPALEALMRELQEPAYRARQAMEWLCRGMKPSEMTNLPKGLREKLSAIPFGGVDIVEKFTSKKDDTEKYLFRMEDDNIVEGVFMRYHYGNTLCLSTQIGCKMGCAFCASTLEGCVRNLSAGEMLSTVAAVERDHADLAADGRAVTNVVLMGSGEPLDNYDNVLSFLRRITAEDGMNISPRNISVSTCGLVPKIYRLMEEAPKVTLCISLHAPNDAIRNAIMPVNRVYPMEELLRAVRAYAERTGRRVIFEYALIQGVNDGAEHAKELSEKLKGMAAHVNLIPLNQVAESNLSGVSRAEAAAFAARLLRLGISATVRRELGTDIEGACGQLRRRMLKNGGFTDGIRIKD